MRHADSTLRPLSDAEFADGLATLEAAAAAEAEPAPVVDHIDLPGLATGDVIPAGAHSAQAKSSVLAADEIATTAGCFKRRSAEIA